MDAEESIALQADSTVLSLSKDLRKCNGCGKLTWASWNGDFAAVVGCECVIAGIRGPISPARDGEGSVVEGERLALWWDRSHL